MLSIDSRVTNGCNLPTPDIKSQCDVVAKTCDVQSAYQLACNG
jgi:hypothetical protein